MDKQEFDQLKERIQITRERIISMFTDINGVDSKLIGQLKMNLQIFEADLIEYGGDIEHECTKETIERTQVAIAKKNLEILNKQSDDIDKGAEIRNKSFEMQKRNAEIQEELIKTQNESVKRQIEHEKFIDGLEHRIVAALEKMAEILDRNVNVRYVTPLSVQVPNVKMNEVTCDSTPEDIQRYGFQLTEKK